MHILSSYHISACFTDIEEDLDAAVRALQDTAQDVEALV